MWHIFESLILERFSTCLNSDNLFSKHNQFLTNHTCPSEFDIEPKAWWAFPNLHNHLPMRGWFICLRALKPNPTFILWFANRSPNWYVFIGSLPCPTTSSCNPTMQLTTATGHSKIDSCQYCFGPHFSLASKMKSFSRFGISEKLFVVTFRGNIKIICRKIKNRKINMDLIYYNKLDFGEI